ncbi:amino acid transporter [Robertmurraya yapensis]|uniref:Amino acid transporter n=1 Tax=Bacillus yapensis TaxID=2492960 RepID=A0A431WF47_9BACI|nr:amino acid transporter [Bacillus yapensis]RTR34015.1 amino acid transporter [Bacillus yapensis]TKS97333.1 amino acid transporter [Bacillus yapensis]
MKEEKEPMNDAIDHLNKIEGNVGNLVQTDLKKLPKPIRYFGYFMFSFFSITILLLLVLQFIK